MKRFVPFIIVVAVALITIAVGAALYRAKRPPTVTISKEKAVANEKTESMHVRGGADAPVTLEEFGDFQCPPCGALSEPLNQLERDYRAKIRLVFRHFPLANHANAKPAAYAAEAAGLQGRFWEMHDLLYREQAVWTKTTDVQSLFDAYAGMIGLNLEQFKKDAGGEQVKAKVESDQKRGEALGVKNTPTIFVDNQSVSPTSLNPTGLRAAIDAAVKEKPKS